jgi:hypothetical protein
MGCSMPLLPLTLCLLFGWRVSERAAFYNTAVSVAVFALGVVFNIYTGPLATLPLIVATGTLLLFEGLFRKSKR